MKMRRPITQILSTAYDVERREVVVTDAMCAEFTREGGEITDFALVYYTVIGGVEHQILRYDCAHGSAHKDVFYVKPPQKQKLPGLSLKTLFTMGFEDIEKNWRVYKEKYLKLGMGGDR